MMIFCIGVHFKFAQITISINDFSGFKRFDTVI